MSGRHRSPSSFNRVSITCRGGSRFWRNALSEAKNAVEDHLRSPRWSSGFSIERVLADRARRRARFVGTRTSFGRSHGGLAFSEGEEGRGEWRERSGLAGDREGVGRPKRDEEAGEQWDSPGRTEGGRRAHSRHNEGRAYHPTAEGFRLPAMHAG